MPATIAMSNFTKTIFGAGLLILALFSAVPASASADSTPESKLRAAIATAGTLGTGLYNCGYELTTAPIEIAPAPGKFQYSALSLAMKQPFTVEGPQGDRDFSNVKLMFLEEPTFEKFFMSDANLVASEYLKATLTVMAETMKQLTVEIVLDKDGKLMRITAFHSVSYLDGKPAQLKPLFGCN